MKRIWEEEKLLPFVGGGGGGRVGKKWGREGEEKGGRGGGLLGWGEDTLLYAHQKDKAGGWEVSTAH